MPFAVTSEFLHSASQFPRGSLAVLLRSSPAAPNRSPLGTSPPLGHTYPLKCLGQASLLGQARLKCLGQARYRDMFCGTLGTCPPLGTCHVLDKQVKLTYVPPSLCLKARSCTQRACEVRITLVSGFRARTHVRTYVRTSVRISFSSQVLLSQAALKSSCKIWKEVQNGGWSHAPRTPRSCSSMYSCQHR